MATLEGLGAVALRRTISAFRDVLVTHAALLDRLNVYPVPDGDTGTNMARTLEAVVAEMDQAPGEMVSTCKAISHGSLMGARGNSGVILSQILRGLAVVFEPDEVVTPRDLAEGLRNGAAAAYRAVLRPVEGTILTVVREAANAAERAAEAGGSLLAVLEAAQDAGRTALDRTPELLPVLKEAGVVDAGGAGFLLFLDAALHVVGGRALPEPPPIDEAGGRPADRIGAAARPAVAGLHYEVMYLLELDDDRVDAFRSGWGAIGDSIVVVGGDGTWNCHIHTDDVGAAVEAALDAGGRPRRIQVTDLLAQAGDTHAASEAAVQRPPAPVGLVTTGVVAVASGPGVMALLRERGVEGMVQGGQTRNPSTAELLAAVDAVPADQVVILPDNANIIAVAEQVDELCSKSVRVVPTVSVVQGLLALDVWDRDAGVDENQAAMVAATAQVRCGEVTRAARSSHCDLGPIDQGAWLGLTAAGGIVGVETGAAAAALQVLGALLAEPAKRVLILTGEGGSEPIVATLRLWLDAKHPGLQVEVHDGGQPLYPYLFGVA